MNRSTKQHVLTVMMTTYCTLLKVDGLIGENSERDNVIISEDFVRFGVVRGRDWSLFVL